jgi:transposase
MTAEQIADLARKKAREKIPQIAASVANHRLSDHQRFLIGHALRHLEFLDQEVAPQSAPTKNFGLRNSGE